MNDKREFWLVETSGAFGMNTKDFCSYLGYSRQAIYQAACGMHKLNRRRFSVALERLEALNVSMLETEQSTAQKRFLQRRKAIEKLEERLVL